MPANSLQKQPDGQRLSREGRAQRCAGIAGWREGGYATRTGNSPEFNLIYQVGGIEPLN
jgi:hypothetical protein